MDFKDKIIVVTGGSNGIGKGLSEQLAKEGAKVIIADIADEAGQAVADAIGGTYFHLDVTDETAVAAMVDAIEADHGPIAGYFSNAGVMFTDGPSYSIYGQSADTWDLVWKVNVLAHLHISRALFPKFIERGEGLFVVTASAAGLLNQIGDTAYSSTKHAAVGFAEAAAITHGDDGIQVAVICPQAVESNMTKGAVGASAMMDGMLSAEEMAKRALAEIKEGRFMVRPHPEVDMYFKNKAENYDRWVGGMRKMRRMQIKATGRPL